MASILVLDNYDSFTFNLVHLLEQLGCNDLTVIRNDKLTLADAARFDKILLSPGPGIPSEAGLMPEIVRTYAAQKPILGVCLGHQCIAEIFGATLSNMAQPMHGKACMVELIDGDDYLFNKLPKNFLIGRYHSWLVKRDSLPQDLRVTAVDQSGEIMALKHIKYDVRGVQFHPESVLTEHGAQLLKNWVAGA